MLKDENKPRLVHVLDSIDSEQLRKMGYDQELTRRLGPFSNFAVSFARICVLAGGITAPAADLLSA